MVTYRAAIAAKKSESIRADSLTAHSLKLALAIAANEGFNLVSADI